MGFSPGQHAIILALARAFVREALERRALLSHSEVDPEFHQPAGCFVSLHVLDDHRLRGCVGRVDASQPFIQALRSASTHVLQDPRFVQCPVCVEELSRLTIEVSVILPPRPAIHSMDFDLLNDGIYLTFGSRSGCFLPQVARETGWTREQLLDRLCLEKLGLPAPTWRHPQARLHAFSVQVIGPEPFEAE